MKTEDGAWDVRLTLAQRSIFFRSLSLLFSSGVHLVKALQSLSQSPQEELALLGLELVKELENGVALPVAMQKFPQAFSNFEVQMVRIGYETGGMAICLERLAMLAERNNGTTQRVKSSLVYPGFLLVGCLLCAVIIPPFLFRGLFDFLRTLNVELPTITKVVAKVSNLVGNPLVLAIGGLILASLIVSTKRILSRPKARVKLYRLGHLLPATRGVLTSLAVTRFSYGFALMLEQGYAVHKALPLTLKSVNDPYFEERGQDAVNALVSGTELSDSLDQTALFSPLFIQSLKVGEETGELPRMIRNIAQLVEDELQSSIDSAVALLEPLTLMIMGVIVGTSAMAALLPLSQVIQSL